jgi:small subunit ribosomal protein S8
MVNDPLGDMLTRIRNAQMRKLPKVITPASKLRAYTKIDRGRGKADLEIELKYSNGQPAIKKISRVSKPGRRVYSSVKDLKPVANGLGVAILSTPKGVMSDWRAREENVGGEVLCSVF